MQLFILFAIMTFEKHESSLEIQNFDNIIESDKIMTNRHSDLLPSTIRCIICGPSNCGKTNVILSLLTHINGLKFENLYLYSKSLNQPKYKFLEECIARVKNVGYFPYTESTEIIIPQNAKPNSIFIFDDIACDKQDCIRQYFSMGRHNFVDCFYLCQTYARIPKHLIRDNANFIIIFKQDDMNLQHIYNDHVNTDMSYEKFKNFCSACWRNKYSFAVINKDSDLSNGRYCNEFDSFLKFT